MVTVQECVVGWERDKRSTPLSGPNISSLIGRARRFGCLGWGFESFLMLRELQSITKLPGKLSVFQIDKKGSSPLWYNLWVTIGFRWMTSLL
jgi:hypothetical protein